MGRFSKPKPPTPPTPSQTEAANDNVESSQTPRVEALPADAAGELPVLESLGMAHVPKKGWVVYRILTQGMTVQDTELLGDSPYTDKEAAADRLKVEVFDRVLFKAFMH